MGNKTAAVIEAIATAILFAVFKQTWILGIGLGLVWSAITAELVEEEAEETVKIIVITTVACIVSALARVIFPEDVGASIFYGIASLCNAALCAAFSSVFHDKSYLRLNNRSYIRTEREAIRYSQDRHSLGVMHIVFVVINIIVYCVLAIAGFAAPAAAFLPLLWVVVRAVYVGLRLKMS